MNRITDAFQNKKALITYITGGDPDLLMTQKLILTLSGLGVDIIEIGIPFSDPLADGPTIQSASQRALKNGVSLELIIQAIAEIKDKVTSPLVLMTYYNSILNFGQDKFISKIKVAGISGVIVPDLPYDEDEHFYQSLNENELAGILLVSPNTPEARLKKIAKRSTGFLYCVSLLGITGDSRGPSAEISGYLKKVRKSTDLPLALGFGIDGPDRVKEIIEQVDGVIIGSALIRKIADSENKEQMFSTIEGFIQEIKSVL